MTEFDELIAVIDIVSTKNKNVMSSASMIFYSIKVKVCYIFAHSFIRDHITIDHYCYLLSLYKTKKYNKSLY